MQTFLFVGSLVFAVLMAALAIMAAYEKKRRTTIAFAVAVPQMLWLAFGEPGALKTGIVLIFFVGNLLLWKWVHKTEPLPKWKKAHPYGDDFRI